ncbi:MAG TPA: D-glycero-beta-D-manno-heptose 1,7-bisphosphate 7-phosphatase [Acidiferrobacterales bacterium]|nr:D-glycero-beta-D-manno-heptose 1,7-bisphosphate 7-phosphatase [Acidiferrobacterales bacterium]
MSLIILDRDGVINYDSDKYIKSPEEWIPIPGSLEAIARLHQEGYKIVVVTNQSGIARGLFDMDILHRIHLKMLEAVRHKGGEIDAISFCPHAPTDGCRCRKPLPGLFEDIAERLKTNLAGVYVVGDSISDVLAARAAYASPVLVRTGKTAPDLEKDELQGVPVFADLAAFADSLLSGRLSPV